MISQFKQRMVRTLQSEVAVEADDRKVVRFPVKKKTIAILIAAAVLVLTIGTAVAAEMDVVPLPKVFSSVITLIKKEKEPEATPSPTPVVYEGRDFKRYIYMTREEREEAGIVIPDIEEAIEEANPETVGYTIEMVPDLKIVKMGSAMNFVKRHLPEEYKKLAEAKKKNNYEAYCQVLRDAGYVILSNIKDAKGIDNYREKMGQSAYSEEDWSWIREIVPEVEEVLVDGAQWSIKIRLNTDHGLNVATYDEGPNWNWNTTSGWPVYVGDDQCIAVSCDEGFFTVDGLDRTVKLPGFRTGVIQKSITSDGFTLQAQWETYDFNQNGAYAEIDEYYADKTDSPFPDEGKVQFTMEIAVRDAKVDEIGKGGSYTDGGLLGVIWYTFEFDASAGKPAAKQAVAEIPLSGEVVMTVIPEKNGRRYNQRISLDGVVLEETIKYQRTGILIQYAVKSAPEGWTDDYTKSLINGLSVACVPENDEGEDRILKPDTFLSATGDMAFSGILPIFPTDYDAVRKEGYKLRLSLERVASVNGEPALDDWVQDELPPEKLDPKHPEYDYVRYFNTFSDIRNVVYEKQVIAEFDLVLP